MDCGPATLKMVAKHHGKEYSLEYLRDQCYLTKEGVNLLGISEAAEKIGFRTLAVKIDINKLVDHAPLPCILHWNQNHFVLLHKVSMGGWFQGRRKFHIADPGHGLLSLSEEDFSKSWLTANTKGVGLLLEPTEQFYAHKEEKRETTNSTGFYFLLGYLRPYKRFIIQLLLSLLLVSGTSLLFPFLTQSMVDNGINKSNLGFIHLILISQLLLFVGNLVVEMVRGWLMLHINSRINLAIISDFLMKLMRLPISFFDTKLIGDLKQRIGDHYRIQSFLTGPGLSTIFSLLNLFFFTIILAVYSRSILAIFLVFTALGVGWIFIFLKKRKKLDYVRFQRMSENENLLFEMISGMQEIKLNNCERNKRWDWERVQAKVYSLNIKSLALGQWQQVGSSFFNQLKNILISYVVAKEVVNGNMTLGMMMSVSYIIGHLNAPVQMLLGFIQSAQDANISLDRLSEIHCKEEEEKPHHKQNLSLLGVQNKGNIEYETFLDGSVDLGESRTGEVDRSPTGISLSGVSFQYTGSRSPFVLHDVNISIPKGKVTAIVGESGSGKTTLMKLLLGFYRPLGLITIDGIDINEVSPSLWRKRCGIVLQDGWIFSDTIAKNISMYDEKPDHQKLKTAVKAANIEEFIESLPLTYNTIIGNSGNGISGGQKQRILISRAIYKDPEYLFFDEATSSLDSKNEKLIMENLGRIFKNRTVVVIAHRMSTVKHADQIIVLDRGQVVEIGNHMKLVDQKGKYYELVKNQLELTP